MRRLIPQIFGFNGCALPFWRLPSKFGFSSRFPHFYCILEGDNRVGGTRAYPQILITGLFLSVILCQKYSSKDFLEKILHFGRFSAQKPGFSPESPKMGLFRVTNLYELKNTLRKG